MAMEEVFSLSLWIVNLHATYVFNLTPFASNLSYICLYGSNLDSDPDPQHCCSASFFQQ